MLTDELINKIKRPGFAESVDRALFSDIEFLKQSYRHYGETETHK